MMSKCMRITILLCWAMSLPACGTSVPEIKGRVVDMVTGQPLADTDVVVAYFGEVSEFTKGVRGFTHTSSEPYCAATRITKSNANGEFSIEAFRLGWGVYKMKYIPIVYKDGYRAEYQSRKVDTQLQARLLQDSMVNEYDERTGQLRDYGKIHGQTVKEYRERFLIPQAYLTEFIRSDGDTYVIFRGCKERRADAAINALAEHIMLRWIDEALTSDPNAMIRASYACGNVVSYVRRSPSFLEKIHSTSERSKSIKALCHKTFLGEGVFDAVLGIK